MKYTFFLTAMLLGFSFWGMSQSGNVASVNCKSGKLSAQLGKQHSFQRLTLKGTLDVRDIRFIRDHVSADTLDLLNVNITAWGTSPKNEFPTTEYERFAKACAQKKTDIAPDALSDTLLSPIRYLIFPVTMSSIDSSALAGFDLSKGVLFPQTLSVIKDNALDVTRTKEYTIPPKVQKLGSTLIMYGAVEKLSFAPGSKLIQVGGTDGGAFGMVMGSNIRVVDLSNCKQFTGKNSFLASHCKNLETVILPQTITVLEKDFIRDCPSLKSLEVLASVPPVMKMDLPKETVVYVPSGSKERYKQSEGWRKYRIEELGDAMAPVEK